MSVETNGFDISLCLSVNVRVLSMTSVTVLKEPQLMASCAMKLNQISYLVDPGCV